MKTEYQFSEVYEYQFPHIRNKEKHNEHICGRHLCASETGHLKMTHIMLGVNQSIHTFEKSYL